MALLINTLLEWTEADGVKRVERLLHLDLPGNIAQVIRVDRSDAQNKPRSFAELEAAVLAGSARILTTDPYAYLQQPEDLIPQKHRQRRDRAMEIISSIVGAPDGGAFNPGIRGPLVEAAVRRFHVTKKRIYRHLRCWMQGGMTRNTLLPRFHDCGGRGKERPAASVKRGRPRLILSTDGNSEGINIGIDERDKLQRGYRLFVLKERGKGGYTVKKAYEMTLMRFPCGSRRACE